MSPSVLQAEDMSSDSVSDLGTAPRATWNNTSSTNGNGHSNGTGNGYSHRNGVRPLNGANGSNGVHATNGTSHTSNGASHAPGVDYGAFGQGSARRKHDPVAIVGMSCRLPGSVSDPNDFFIMCARERSGWVEVPEERFSKKGWYHPNPDKLGCFNPVGGFFLAEDIALFDAPFFNITQREALTMDPQHRLILECTYEALENAGIPKHKLVGKNVGVFAGGSFTDYELNNLRDVETCPMYEATGNAPSLMSNRVSYHFDFRGPSHTIETACSSSLTALHIGMQSLQRGDSSVVILASSHLNLLPDQFTTMSTQSLLSSDGRSHAFDSRANGFARGEGCCVIVLKPLSEALKDNDNIRAVILATGTNQDGRTNGITMPSGESQLSLMRQVYADAGLNPTETGYVEAHGTGTKVGDPIEMRAIHDMFSEGRTEEDPLYVGSAKTNVGHLEGASGLVGIIKSVLMLERKLIVPNFDFRQGNPEIPFKDWSIEVPTTITPWPKNKKYISVNSFGFGGANAHAVLAAPERRKKVATNWDFDYVEPRRLFVVSAHSKEALAAQMKNVTVYLETHPPVFQFNIIPNLAYTLGERRSFLPYKVAISGSDPSKLTEAFSTALTNPVRSTRPPTIGFVYTGQGAQWHAMGRELIEAYPVFKKSLERFDSCLRRLGATFSMMDELHMDAKSSRLSTAELSQPCCTAIQLAVTDLLSDWGVRPQAVVGHSSGEIAAAYAAGALTYDECAAIAYFRGQSVLELKAAHPELEGGMLAVGATPEEVLPMIKMLRSGRATVACVNSPGSITASGDVDAITELANKIEQKQLFNRRVRVDTAYHSHHMELVAEWYGDAVGTLAPRYQSDVAFYSSLRGHRIDTDELDTTYWVQNLTRPVLFSPALTDMCAPKSGKEEVDLLVEIGPHSALEGPVKQILKAIEGLAKKPLYLSSLVRNKDAIETTIDLAGSLFTHGAMLDFHAINFPVPSQTQLEVLRDFPKYPWDHSTRYWWESRVSKAHLHRPFPRNDVVGTLSDYSNELEPTWRHIIRPDDVPWVRGHIMQGMIIYPMCGYLTMAVEAAAQRAILLGKPFDKFVLRDVSINHPLVIQEDADTEVNLNMRPFTEGTRHDSTSWDEFKVFSWTRERGWVEHCRGLIRVEQTAADPICDTLAAHEAALEKRKRYIEAESINPVDSDNIYKELEGVTAKYTPQFRSMENCMASDTTCVAEAVVPDMRPIMPKGHEPELYIHPSFLDQFTHAAWVILGAGRGHLHNLYMPRHFNSLSISTSVCKAPGDRLRVYGTGKANYDNPVPATITMFATSMDGGPDLISMDGLTLDPFLDDGGLAGTAPARELCYKMTWEPILADQPENKEAATELPKLIDNITIISTPSQRRALASTMKDHFSRFSTSDISLEALDGAEIDGKICIVISELGHPLLSTLDAESFVNVQKMAQRAKGVLWVVRGAHTESTDPKLAMILGLARTIRSESGLKFATLDLDGVNPLPAAAVAKTIFEVSSRVFGKGTPSSPDMEFQERQGSISVCRVASDPELDAFVEQHTNPSTPPFLQPFKQPNRPLKATVGTKGALDTIHFVDDETVATPLQADEVSIEIAVTSMNFKDIMVAMGEVPSPYLGVECAGVIHEVGSNVTDFKVGDRVCASCEGAYSTYTRCKSTSVARVPSDMTLEAAATVPVVFCTAFYSIFDIARLQRGESILIHAAAGGVGQAAIMLSQMAGAEIYVTVGSQAKKTFLIETYGIAEDHIFYSRDITFAKGIQRLTNGRGVDVVLNSLSGDALRATWECIAHFGRFVEIGKRDILGNSGLGMAMFENNATFASVDLTVVANERPQVMRRILDDVFKLLGYKLVRPISPITAMPISQIEDAFRTLQSGKVHGKVLLTAGPDNTIKATRPAKSFDGIFHSDATYIIVGGTGGIGRSITRWMVQRGAKDVVLVSRSAKISDQVAKVIKEAEQVGARVVLRRCDVSSSEEVKSMIQEITAQMPPVRGVIHSAMVLDDVLFEKMDFSQWDKVVRSKVAGCWNLHTALENTAVDFFIALSSVAGVIGNLGQAAYAAANTFLDSFVQYRHRQGLAATALDLAAVSDTGYLAENAEKQKLVIDQLGGEAISESEILSLIAASVTGLAEKTCQSQVITGLKLPAAYTNVFWATDAKFGAIRARANALEGADVDPSQNMSPGQALRHATSYDAAYHIVLNALLDKTAAVLLLPREELNPNKATLFYGLDSLVSIEIRNWITREFGAALQILDLLSSGSFVALAEIILHKTELVSFEKPA